MADKSIEDKVKGIASKAESSVRRPEPARITPQYHPPIKSAETYSAQNTGSSKLFLRILSVGLSLACSIGLGYGIYRYFSKNDANDATKNLPAVASVSSEIRPSVKSSPNNAPVLIPKPKPVPRKDYSPQVLALKKDMSRKNYSGLSERARSLYDSITRDTNCVARQELMSELEKLSYTRMDRVEATIDKILVKEGYNETVEKKARYRYSRPDGLFHYVEFYSDDKGPVTYNNNGPFFRREQVSPAKTEQKWHEPVYNTVTNPPYFKEIEVSVLSGTERVVRDKIPIK